MTEDVITNINPTKKALSEEYYPLWASDMDILITLKKLDEFIYEKKIEIVVKILSISLIHYII